MEKETKESKDKKEKEKLWSFKNKKTVGDKYKIKSQKKKNVKNS